MKEVSILQIHVTILLLLYFIYYNIYLKRNTSTQQNVPWHVACMINDITLVHKSLSLKYY